MRPYIFLLPAPQRLGEKLRLVQRKRRQVAAAPEESSSFLDSVKCTLIQLGYQVKKRMLKTKQNNEMKMIVDLITHCIKQHSEVGTPASSPESQGTRDTTPQALFPCSSHSTPATDTSEIPGTSASITSHPWVEPLQGPTNHPQHLVTAGVFFLQVRLFKNLSLEKQTYPLLLCLCTYTVFVKMDRHIDSEP